MARRKKDADSEVDLTKEIDDLANDTSTDEVDEYVGHRICARRRLLQMSQKEMAEKLGITFQQVQKYEKGINRIGAGRLHSIANILGVDIDYFYEEINEDEAEEDTFYDNEFDNGFLREDGGDLRVDPMYGAEAIMLLKAFYSLPPKTRTYLLMMLTSFKDKENTKSGL